MNRIEGVIVTVPARDEAARIGRCLAAIAAAVETWAGPTIVLVGADSCADDTAAVVRELADGGLAVLLVEGSWRRPAPVRRALVDRGRRHFADVPPAQLWVASTDADCIVPSRWIDEQVRLADAGADVIVGEVALDPGDTPDALAGAFGRHYAELGARRRHVHAANLGIRLRSYDLAGGWRSSTQIGEEHHLVRVAVERGAAMHDGEAPTVVTSGRTASRVRGGFASALRRLEPTGV